MALKNKDIYLAVACSSSLQTVKQMRISETAHVIMVLFVLHKLILQTLMASHPAGLDVWFLVGRFVYFHTSCVRTLKTLARLCGRAGSPEPSMVAYVISTIISWAGSFYDNFITGFCYFSIKTHVAVTHYSCLAEAILMSTNNICFYGEL